MGIYQYTPISSTIYPIPIILIQLQSPNPQDSIRVNAQGILDTGADCTLIPIPLLIQVKARIIDTAIRIPVGGVITLGIPYIVGFRLDRYTHQAFRVFGCPVNEIGELLIIGRDLMNLHRIEFDGQKLTFRIF